MQYSSKDFSLTRPDFEPRVPERLAHHGVCDQLDATFSRERGHGVAIVDLPSRTISMTIGRLNVAEQTRLHRHSYETVIYVVKGQGFSRIEDRVVNWKPGDALYVPVWTWHQHVNTGTTEAEYVACENTPLLQNLGVAIRQESAATPRKRSPLYD
jgi:quercetin dioxygenase-like cupin family protein